LEESDRLMRYWLFKTEPTVWGWEDQVARGDKGEEWDGVRNYQARNFMREMEIGDLGFFYHSQTEKAVVGIVEVIKPAHPDSTTDDSRWECVDIKAVKPVVTPVTLDQIKADDRLGDMMLVRNSRLSVQPVTAEEWRIVCALAGLSD
jgi:predicted RNA-binding protein with PUA-like domain